MSVRDRARADPVLEQWCERPEVLAVTIRVPDDDGGSDVYIDGHPPALHRARWFLPSNFGPTSVMHGLKWPGARQYEFVVYNAEVLDDGRVKFRIELILDLLQLQGRQGVTWWDTGDSPSDPKR